MDFSIRDETYWYIKTLIVSSNANNGTNASLSYFNSNNGVSNANTNVS